MSQHPTSPPSRSQPGPDGIVRSPEAEEIINLLAIGTFTSEAGRQFLQYLRQITVLSVCGPEVSDAALRHREGMRNLVGIIEQRISLGGQIDRSEPKPQPKSRASRRFGPA